MGCDLSIRPPDKILSPGIKIDSFVTSTSPANDVMKNPPTLTLEPCWNEESEECSCPCVGYLVHVSKAIRLKDIALSKCCSCVITVPIRIMGWLYMGGSDTFNCFFNRFSNQGCLGSISRLSINHIQCPLKLLLVNNTILQWSWAHGISITI